MKREAYLCLSAMLRAREQKLLNNDRALRMLECGSFDEAAKILTDCGYTDLSGMSVQEVDAALNAHRKAVFSEIENMCPQKEIVDVFRMKYDYHNLKAIIKSEAMGIDGSYLLSSSGRIAGEKLLALYNDGYFSSMPGRMGIAAEEARNALSRTSNPQLSDIVLDKAYFSELREAAEAVNCDFLNKYMDLLTDTANVRTLVRTVRTGTGTSLLEEALLPGGGIDIDRLKKTAGKDALKELCSGSLPEKTAELGAAAMSGGSMTAFELECDNTVNAFLRSARRVSYGAEAVIAYLAAKEEEITAVRMILTGKLAGIAPQTIRERLRDLYA